MPFLDANGVRLAYLEWAPPSDTAARSHALLLHAITGRASLWQPIASRLVQAGISAVAVDLRGHGDSDRASDYRVETLAADAARLIEERMSPPIDVLGHSIGGTVAWTLAARRPGLVRRLVIEDQRPASDARHETYWRKWAAEWPWTLPSKEAALAYLRDHHRARLWWEPSLVPRPDGTWGWAFDRDAVLEMAAGLLARSDWDALAGVRAPTLIIRGGKSAHVKPEVAARMASTIPSARIVTIDDADHWVNRRAAPYAEAVVEFLTLG